MSSHAHPEVTEDVPRPNRIQITTPIFPPGLSIPQALAVVNSRIIYDNKTHLRRSLNPAPCLQRQIGSSTHPRNAIAMNSMNELEMSMGNLRLDHVPRHEVFEGRSQSQRLAGHMRSDSGYVSNGEATQGLSSQNAGADDTPTFSYVTDPSMSGQQTAMTTGQDEQVEVSHIEYASGSGFGRTNSENADAASEHNTGDQLQASDSISRENRPVDRLRMIKLEVECAFRIAKLRDIFKPGACDTKPQRIADRGVVKRRYMSRRLAKRKRITELQVFYSKRRRCNFNFQPLQARRLKQRENALIVGRDRQANIKEIRKQRSFKLWHGPKYKAWRVRHKSSLRKELKVVEQENQATRQIETYLEEVMSDSSSDEEGEENENPNESPAVDEEESSSDWDSGSDSTSNISVNF